jgi:hypothetical protein
MRNSLVHWIARVVVVTTLILTALVVVTPQGRSLAQGLLQLFTPTEETSFPLSDAQIARAPEEDSPTVEAPVPFLTVAEAEAQAGFEAAELASVPAGLTYLGAKVYDDTISIEYEAEGQGSQLVITQSQDGYPESDWDRVPPAYVVPVTIGDLTGEFAQGAFVVRPGEETATWNPEVPNLRLRWKADGVGYEIAKYGDVEAVAYLDQDALIALAEELMEQ